MDFLLNFFSEVFTRLNSKSPKFFVIWQWFFAILTLVSLIPTGLEFLNITLVGYKLSLITKMTSAAGGLLWIMAKMPIKPQIVTMTTDGAVIQKTDETKLPITMKDQKREAVDEGKVSSMTLPEVTKEVHR